MSFDPISNARGEPRRSTRHTGRSESALRGRPGEKIVIQVKPETYSGPTIRLTVTSQTWRRSVLVVKAVWKALDHEPTDQEFQAIELEVPDLPYAKEVVRGEEVAFVSFEEHEKLLATAHTLDADSHRYVVDLLWEAGSSPDTLARYFTLLAPGVGDKSYVFKEDVEDSIKTAVYYQLGSIWFEPAQLFVRFQPYPGMPNILNTRDNRYIDWAIEHVPVDPVDASVMDMAFYTRSPIEHVHRLLEAGWKFWTVNVIKAAIHSDHPLELLEELRQHGADFDDVEYETLVGYQVKPEVLDYMLNYVSETVVLDPECTLMAAMKNHGDLLTILIKHGCPWSHDAVPMAVEHRKFPFVRRALLLGCPVDTGVVYEMILQNWWEGIMLLAARDPQEGFWDADLCTQAAKEGKFNCLFYLRFAGCPWGAETMYRAWKNRHDPGSKKCYEFCVARGCPVDRRIDPPPPEPLPEPDLEEFGRSVVTGRELFLERQQQMITEAKGAPNRRLRKINPLGKTQTRHRMILKVRRPEQTPVMAGLVRLHVSEELAMSPYMQGYVEVGDVIDLPDMPYLTELIEHEPIPETSEAYEAAIETSVSMMLPTKKLVQKLIQNAMLGHLQRYFTLASHGETYVVNRNLEPELVEAIQDAYPQGLDASMVRPSRDTNMDMTGAKGEPRRRHRKRNHLSPPHRQVELHSPRDYDSEDDAPLPPEDPSEKPPVTIRRFVTVRLTPALRTYPYFESFMEDEVEVPERPYVREILTKKVIPFSFEAYEEAIQTAGYFTLPSKHLVKALVWYAGASEARFSKYFERITVWDEDEGYDATKWRLNPGLDRTLRSEMSLAYPNAHYEPAAVDVRFGDWRGEDVVQHGSVRLLRSFLDTHPVTDFAFNMVVHYAAKYPDATRLEMLITHGYQAKPGDITTAAGAGSLACMKSLVQHGIQAKSGVVASAARGGNLDCLKYAHELQSGRPDAYAMSSAVRYNRVECLEWLLDHGYTAQDSTLWVAAESGAIDCMKLLIARGLELDHRTGCKAAEEGQVRVLEYMHTLGYVFNQHHVDASIDEDGVPALVWFLDHGIGPPNDACYRAVDRGVVDALKVLHQHGSPWGVECTWRALHRRHFECFEYLCDNGGPLEAAMTTWVAGSFLDTKWVDCLIRNRCPWAEDATAAILRHGQSLAMLKYAHEHGAPWDRRITFFAMYCNNHECLEYALANGCDVDQDTLDKFRRGGVIEYDSSMFY